VCWRKKAALPDPAHPAGFYVAPHVLVVRAEFVKQRATVARRRGEQALLDVFDRFQRSEFITGNKLPKTLPPQKKSAITAFMAFSSQNRGKIWTVLLLV